MSTVPSSSMPRFTAWSSPTLRPRHPIAMSLSLVLLCGAVKAQSTIYGQDVRQSRFFTTTADANFVSNFTTIGAGLSQAVFAIDFDEHAAVLWGILNTTTEYGFFDLATGVFQPQGVVTAFTGASGLTCDVNGTWYASSVSGTGTNLYFGDVTTGSFTLIGNVAPGIIIDIAISSTGAMYGHNITENAIYSIDLNTGAGTFLGLHGYNTNFAQGMDFDWSDDTLYAAFYTGGGTGAFVAIDLATGVATPLADTFPLNGEFEFAVCALPAGCPIVEFCPGDGSGTACPFGNDNNGSNGIAGCANSAFPEGGKLTSTGTCSIAKGDLVLRGSRLATCINPTALFIQGNNATSGGNGIPFLDGLRCASGSTVRIEKVVVDATGECATTVDIGAVGGVLPGDVRRYQIWYRDQCGYTGYNLSNGLEVAWTP